MHSSKKIAFKTMFVMEKRSRNLLLAALGLFFLIPRSKASTGGGSPGTNGFVPVKGSNGSLDESFLGIQGPRGVRNNNPGNVRFYISSYNSDPWQGEIPPSQNTDGTYQGWPKFCQFVAYPYGVRVMIYLLKLRYIPQGHNTIAKILAKYDPGHSQGYLTYVSSTVGISENQVISQSDDTTIKKVIQAIARFENDRKLPTDPEVITDAQYQTALSIL